MKKHEQGFELFREHDGNIDDATIGEHLDVSKATVRKWRSRYKWLENMGNDECDKNVTAEDSVTELSEREKQRNRVIDSLIEAGTYSPAYDLLIEIYLDAYIEYIDARANGEADEKQRREIANLLNRLGLDGKNKELVKKSGLLLARGDEEKSVEEEKPVEDTPNVSKLSDFRNRRKKA